MTSVPVNNDHFRIGLHAFHKDAVTLRTLVHCARRNNEAVNTVCLDFSDEFIEFSQSWFYRWFLAKITDFWRRLRIFGEDYGFFGEDYGFLYLCQCLLACTEHVQTY